jgi:hypothetical protein
MASPRTRPAPERSAEPGPRELSATVNATIGALERLLALFRVERYLHLALGIISFLLLLYTVFEMVRTGKVGDGNLMMIFGASGLFAAASFRTTYFFGKGFRLIDDLLRHLLGIGKPGDDA